MSSLYAIITVPYMQLRYITPDLRIHALLFLGIPRYLIGNININMLRKLSQYIEKTRRNFVLGITVVFLASVKREHIDLIVISQLTRSLDIS
jgi:hypothetical protein